MTGALKKQLDAYTLVQNLFGVLHEIFNLTPESIRESSNRLVETYPEDLEHDLAEELCSFATSPAAAVVSSKAMRQLALFACTALLPHQVSGKHICISYPCGTITAQKQALCILMSLSLACMVEQRAISLAG